MRKPKRRLTRKVRVGALLLGGGEPVRVQSMLSTPTSAIQATVRQAEALAAAGCEIVRMAVPDRESAEALPELRKRLSMPLVADIHFNPAFALAALEAGFDKIRINPGNLGGPERFRAILNAAKERNAAIRIGVNSGSVEKDLLERYGGPTAEAMVESALRWIALCERESFAQVVISLKASGALEAVTANRRFSQVSDYPLHLGITEAGGRDYGSLKSAVGIGALLLDGIGDTIRVSLTGDPLQEIPVAYDILKAAGVRVLTPEVVSCPTCGRLQYDMAAVAAEVERRLATVKKPIRVAIMGCVVNGPGESAEADVALAGGNQSAVLYVRGKETGRVRPEAMVEAVVRAVLEF